MSFSFNYVARNKVAAQQQLVKEFAPETVKTFVSVAISGIKKDGLIAVKANGHLADGQSYEVSTSTIEVRPLDLIVEEEAEKVDG